MMSQFARLYVIAFTEIAWLHLTEPTSQSFDFGFEEEDGIEGMKRLIVEEVQAFRAEVRQQARAGGQIRRQDRYDHSPLSS